MYCLNTKATSPSSFLRFRIILIPIETSLETIHMTLVHFLFKHIKNHDTFHATHSCLNLSFVLRIAWWLISYDCFSYNSEGQTKTLDFLSLPCQKSWHFLLLNTNILKTPEYRCMKFVYKNQLSKSMCLIHTRALCVSDTEFCNICCGILNANIKYQIIGGYYPRL